MNRIVRILIASGLLLALHSRACGAALPPTQGFDLSWHNCIGLPGAALNLAYACDGSRDGNPFRLVVTFTPPSHLSQFVAAEVFLSVRTPLSVLPDWWRLGMGECRADGIAFPGSRTGIGTGTTGACINPWPSGTSSGGGYEWLSDTGFSCGQVCSSFPAAGYGLLHLAFARDTAIPLQAGQRYLMPPILIESSNPDSCSGCSIPACLFVRAVELQQVAGATPPEQDIYILNLPMERSYVTWQGGAPSEACPLEVPTRRATWGAIKAIYR